ncbi:Cuticle-degrading protease-like protein 1 [Elsinoe fawcettii]|nr:Cuticle-degrading protease-like protein 1 [Elsinoe fawcettii]
MRSFLLASLAATTFALPAHLDVLPRDATPTIIPNEYVITLKDHKDDVDSFIKSHSAIAHKEPGRTYHIETFRGFSMNLTPEEVKALEAHPSVLSVESDMLIRGHAITEQQAGNWGLAKLSQGTGSASNSYDFDDTAGEGTCSYVVDTGVAVDHPDFEGRAVFGVNFEPTDGTNEDLGRHGTHASTSPNLLQCAGTIGSKTYGVAKKTKIIAVKACNQGVTCRYQDIVSGITWATQDSKTRGCPKGSVINLSLGGWGTWVATREAVNAAVANGMFVSVAAGNSYKDASDTYPASAPNACTVAASDSNNNFASFSNFGSVIDVIAPGVQITSLSTDGGTYIMSGTSMAAPYVAGLGAYLLAAEGSADPVALCQKIKDRAVKNAIKNVPSGTNNLLVYNGASGGVSASAPSPQQPPSGNSAAGPTGGFSGNTGNNGGRSGESAPVRQPSSGSTGGSNSGLTGGSTGSSPGSSSGSGSFWGFPMSSLPSGLFSSRPSGGSFSYFNKGQGMASTPASPPASPPVSGSDPSGGNTKTWSKTWSTGNLSGEDLKSLWSKITGAGSS